MLCRNWHERSSVLHTITPKRKFNGNAASWNDEEAARTRVEAGHQRTLARVGENTSATPAYVLEINGDTRRLIQQNRKREEGSSM